MPQSPLISFEYVVQNELENPNQPGGGGLQQPSTNYINGVPVMTHPTVNGNVKHSSTNNPSLTRPGYQVFRAQPQENLEVWLHGPR